MAATTLTLEPMGVPIDGTSKFTISINYGSGSRLKDVTVTVYDTAPAVATYSLGTITGNSFTWTPPLSLLNALPNTLQGEVKITGTPANALGLATESAVTGWGYVTVPKSYTPTAPTNLVMTPINDGVPAGWNVCLQGISKATASWTASSGKGGASIAYYHVALDSSPSDFIKATTTSTTIPSLSLSGTRTLTVKAVDSRGLTSDPAMVVYTVEPYTRPEMTTHLAERCRADGSADNLGTYLKARVAYTFASVGGRNSAHATYAYKLSTDSAYSAEIELQQATDVVFGGAFLPTKTYNIRFTVADAVGITTTYVATVEALTLGLCFLAGAAGAAFGKDATLHGVLETMWPIVFSNGWSLGYGFIEGREALVIRNRAGTGIAAFENTGNLWLRGTVQTGKTF